MSKGSKSRVTDAQVYADNYDLIFNNADTGPGCGLTTTDTRKWGFAHHADSESWHQSDYTTREEVISEARDYYDTYYLAICRCEPIDIDVTIPSADDIAEQMSESAGDNYGPWVEAYPDVSRAALNELDELLKTWARKHVTDHYWQAEDIETIEGQTT